MSSRTNLEALLADDQFAMPDGVLEKRIASNSISRVAVKPTERIMTGRNIQRHNGISRRGVVAASIAAVAVPTLARAEASSTAGEVPAGYTNGGANSGGREVPARVIPVPTTVSAELQARIDAPYPPGWDKVPATEAAWSEMARQSAADVAPFLPGIKEDLKLTVERSEMGGVGVFVITPESIPEANRNRLLLHLHGGGYVLYPGEAGAGEGMLLAGLGGFRVVSVDYRMAPEHPFPAALDDTLAVWKELLKDNDPRRMAVFGSSAGGALTLSLMLRARQEGLALPAAIAPGTPAADLTGAGDTMKTNEFIDNYLVSGSGWAEAATRLYAGHADLHDALVSPLFGDFTGMPPAILTSGTRDLFLSHTVRVHRKLRQAGIEAALQVFEGISHAQYLDHTLPEGREALGEIATFFDRHLAR